MSAFPEIRVVALTDVGVKRSHNQDACTAQPATDADHFRAHGHILVVADGMGGHAVGEKASAKAVRDIPLTYLKHVAQDGPPAAIRRAFKEANSSIYQIGVNNPEFKGLGTTATAVMILPDGAWLGHVGDSRAYRIRADAVQQLTFDHSWVWEVARRQGVDPDELGDFKRNVIIRSLGPDAEVEVDIEGPHPVEPGDRFLLCSDGLSNMVTNDEIGAVVSTFPADEAARFLIDLSNARGGPDNITCVIAEVPGTAPARSAGPRPSVKINAAIARWNKVVPWPLTALGLAVMTAGLSVGLHLTGLPGAVLVFLIAAGLIAAGVVGLIVQVRNRDEAAETDAEQSLELRIYRNYPFVLDAVQADRMAAFAKKLKDEVSAADVPVDWPAYEHHTSESDSFASKGDWPKSFHSRCLAVHALARPYNKHRQKDEAFKPNWTPKKSHG